MKHILFINIVILLITYSTHCLATNTSHNDNTITIINQHNQKITFKVEIANTPKKRKQGLMFRQHLAQDTGMLFQFNNPQKINMWMKNTSIPLDIIFINPNNQIDQIVKNTTPNSSKTISSTNNITAVLEINASLTDKLFINKNDKVLYNIGKTNESQNNQQ